MELNSVGLQAYSLFITFGLPEILEKKEKGTKNYTSDCKPTSNQKEK